MATYHRIVQELYDLYDISPDQLISMKNSDARVVLWNILINCGKNGYPLEISGLKNRSGQNFKRSGKSIADRLFALQGAEHGQLWSIIFELGDLPLYSKETTRIARLISKAILGKCPRYEKLERADTRNNKVHLHVCAVLPEDFKFVTRYNGFTVKYERMGSKKEYQNVPLYTQVCKFVRYFQKPAERRANCSRFNLRMQAYYEWFERSHNKNLLSKKGEGFRQSWSSNLRRL